MEDRDILLQLKSEQESWLTSIRVTEEEALGLLNLTRFSRNTVQLPSVGGYAAVNGSLLEIHYQAQKHENVIAAPLVDAQAVIQEAVDDARESRRSEAARLRIWDWINERYDDTRVLTLSKGEQITALLLSQDEEHLAIQLDDGTTAIAEVADKNAVPPANSRITITASDNGELVVNSDVPP